MTTNNGDWVFRAGISYAKDDDYTLEPVRAHSRCDARRKPTAATTFEEGSRSCVSASSRASMLRSTPYRCLA